MEHEATCPAVALDMDDMGPCTCRFGRLRTKIAEQDRLRGRPLTDREKLQNLERALGFEPGRLAK